MSNTWRQSTWTSAVISIAENVATFHNCNVGSYQQKSGAFFFGVTGKIPWKSGHRLHPRNLNSYVWKEIYMFQPSFSASVFFRGMCILCCLWSYHIPSNQPLRPYVWPKEVTFLWQVSWSGSLVLLKDQGTFRLMYCCCWWKNPKQSPNTYETL